MASDTAGFGTPQTAAEGQMAQGWYSLIPGVTPTAHDLAWWQKQIAQDGSNTAFKNFTAGIAKDHGPQAAQTLAQNAAAYKAQSGLDPWTPSTGAVNGQIPGTTQTLLGGIGQWGDANKAVGKDVGLGLMTAGALLPVGAGVAGAAGAAGAAGVGAKAIPDAATMAPGALSTVADASAPAGAVGAAVGVPASSDALGVLKNALGGGSATGPNWLSAAGNALDAGVTQQNNANSLAEKKREFDAQNALATQATAQNEGAQAVTTQNKLNTAPLADNAQALLMAKMGPAAAPTAFQPRDYTQAGGTNNLATPATGGAASQLAANQAASAAYKPGAGGVDTSTLQLLLAKLKGSGSAFGNMPTTSPTATG